jgi:GGDEF domain-containing protein
MGGDEFVTLLRGDDGERAAGLAAALERGFAGWPPPAEIAAHSRGVSIGHVRRRPGEHSRQLPRRGAETMRAAKRRRKSDR